MAKSDAQNQIEIFQIDDIYKFWYKKCNNLVEDRRLEELEENLKRYANDLLEWQEHQQPINRTDEVVVFHSGWNKWIRGKAGKLKTGSKAEIDIWAIDYGFKMTVPLKDVYLLEDRLLACKNPINVHIGGLSGIVPSKVDLNIETLAAEIVRCDSWTRESIEQFKECIRDRKFLTFHVERPESLRNFGQLLLHSENGNKTPYSVANGLCKWGQAIQDRNYMHEVQKISLLDREDFLRLNCQLAFRVDFENEMAIEDDEIANAERIFLDDDVLSSIDLELEEKPSDQVDNCQKHENRSQHSRSHASSSLAISGITGNLLSEETNTLSVKLLNIMNVLNITSDEVTPVKNWDNITYFTSQAKQFLKRKIATTEIDPQCSYGWPHVMRTNSLLLIGEPIKNLLLCLPTVCSIKQTVSTWSTKESIEPFAIIFVTCAEEVELMAKYCRKMNASSGLDEVSVYCLNGSLEIEALIKSAITIDILVAPVFCFDVIVQHMPKLTTRLRYVWFHQIDEMWEINKDLTNNVAEKLLADDLDIQIVTSSTTYCPILVDLFDRAKVPMISIGGRSPFEAALFANCHFSAAFEENTVKIKRLIEKLQYRLNGSIVIMCATRSDVKFVSGHLTQANIKCIELDDQYSGNQMKLIQWSKRCLTEDTQSGSHLNILICDDETLEKFPIRSAQHIVHYSLPQKLETFKQRHITCYGFYEDRLRRKLLFQEKDLQRPISHVYFDEHFTGEYIEIFELLLKRAQCHLPAFLIEIVQEMRYNFERNKMKPLCGELITRLVDCDMQCPYRHTLYNNCNDTNVPELVDGYVNMELLGVLAPNHFAVRVIGHKRCLEHKSKSLQCLTSDWEQFDKQLREHYANAAREIHEPIEIGDMCLIFHQSQPKRCRVISMEKNCVSVFLVDIGRIRSYKPDQLYRLDDEFYDYPTQAIEIYVLGYLPSDCSPKWLPEANDYVKSLMNLMKEERRTQNYLQAEVIKGFERTLIVKDLKMMFKGKNQLAVKSVSKKLIKSGCASAVPVTLHEIFLEQNNESDNDTQINSEIIDNTMGYESSSRYAMQLSRQPSSDGIQVTSLENCENPSPKCMAYMLKKKKRSSESTSPASLDDNIDGGIGSKTGMDESDWDEIENNSFHYDNNACTKAEVEKIVPELDEIDAKGFIVNINDYMNADNQQKSAQAPNMDVIDMPLIDFGCRDNGQNNSGPEHVFNLDEIFGSLPENIQVNDILQPIRCYANDSSSNNAQQTEPENTAWLIDFSD